MQRSAFTKWADVSNVFPAADYVLGVRPLIIFNISGNKYRLVANIDYARQRVYIKHIFTHAEYDVWNKGGRK